MNPPLSSDPKSKINWQELYELGLSLIPVRVREKIPATKWAGYQKQRATLDEMGAWEKVGGNAGIVTGAISNIIVLDCDTLEAIGRAKQLGIPDNTVSVETAKGCHFYFLHPGFCVSNKTNLLPGMDLRGDGGFVVAPGSIHPSGVEYRWINHPAWNEIGPLPSWLIEMLREQSAVAASASAPMSVVTNCGKSALDRELTILRNTPKGGRNHQLNRSSFALAQLVAGGEIAEEMALDSLREAAFSIGLVEDEIEATIHSGWQAGRRAARNSRQKAEPTKISATPFIMPKVADIPPRPWIMGRWLMRETVTTVIAPGGTGKSALMVAAALSLASGKNLMGQTIWGFPKHVWLWNLEDDGDELARQVAACCQHHGLSDEDYVDRLFVNDAGSELCTATKERDGLIIHEPVYAAIVQEIRAYRIDVLIVDPFVSSHRAEENDNGQIDAIAKQWASIARETHCSIVLVHHSRKLGGQQVDAEAARGASALGNAARSVLVLNRMDQKEFVRLGISEEDRSSYVRVSNDKSNRAPAEKADWYRKISVRLANGGPEGGDSVVAIERWAPPEIAAIFDDAIRAKIQAEISLGEWRAHISADNWAGKAVAKVIGADISIPAEKRRAAVLLKDMLAKGQLGTAQRKDASRKWRNFVIVGERAGCDDDPPQW